MKLNHAIRKYTLVVLLAYGAVAASIAVNYLVLYRTGELAELPAVVAAQQKNGGLHNGLSVGMAAYKYEAYRQRHPEIVALGTSRAMQIRDYFFTRPFYNLGGLVQGQAQAFALMDGLLLKQPPKTVILVADFWTFCARREEIPPFGRPTGSYHDGQGDPNKPVLLWRLFAEGRLSAADLGKIFRGVFNPPQRLVPRSGISSLLSDSGFGPDGSLFKLVSQGSVDQTSDIEDRSREDIDALRRGVGRVPVDCNVSDENMALLGMMGAELAGYGIDLIIIAPPITSALLKAVESTPAANAYMTTWRRRFMAAWPQTYDFTDPRTIGSSDCEFYDGIHGGEVTYARIFRALVDTGNVQLVRALNIENLDRAIAGSKNKITAALGFSEKVRDAELGGFKACNP